jgi:hypothetical protein
MKTKLLLVITILAAYGKLSAQTVYDNFENIRHVRYVHVSSPKSKIDTVATPDTGSVNHSAMCARYIPTPHLLYNDIRMVTDSAFNILPYAYGSSRLTLKILTNDTNSRVVRIQVGRRQGSNDAIDTSYSKSIYFEFEAHTTKNHKGAWEMLSFVPVYKNKLFDTVANPVTSLNKLILFFGYQDTAKMAHDTVYFDELSGPAFSGVAAVNTLKPSNIKELSVYPNPASGEITVNFNLVSPADVKLNITDITGRVVKSYSSEKNYGNYSRTLSLDGMQTGMYYLQVSSGDESRTEKFIVK